MLELYIAKQNKIDYIVYSNKPPKKTKLRAI